MPASGRVVWLAAHKRQNWARWLLFAGFLIIGILICLKPNYYFENPVLGIAQLTVTALEATAYWFAFRGAGSRDWFARRDPDRHQCFEV